MVRHEIILSGIFLPAGSRSRRRRYRGTVTIVGVKVARTKRIERERDRTLEMESERCIYRERGGGREKQQRVESKYGRCKLIAFEGKRQLYAIQEKRYTKAKGRGRIALTVAEREEKGRFPLSRIGVSTRDLFREGMLIN